MPDRLSPPSSSITCPPTSSKSVSSVIEEMRTIGLLLPDQYLAMAFAQLTYRESLRDIEACLGSMRGKLYHMGFRGRVTRSTLGDANEAHDWRIFADFAQVLIAIARPLYAGDPIGWTSFRRCMHWIRQRLIFVCRCFRGPGSASTRGR